MQNTGIPVNSVRFIVRKISTVTQKDAAESRDLRAYCRKINGLPFLRRCPRTAQQKDTNTHPERVVHNNPR